jgi:hypothetical protein
MSIKYKSQIEIPRAPTADNEIVRKLELDTVTKVALNAQGEYETVTSAFDADGVIIGALKYYLSGATTASNIPVNKPCFFTNGYDSAKAVAIQSCLSSSGPPLYIRIGAVSVSNNVYSATWGNWQQLGSSGGGGGVPSRASQLLSSGLSAGTAISVPAYTVGAGTLFVYLNGLLLEKGSEYNEVGTADTESTTLTFTDDIPAGARFSFILY